MKIKNYSLILISGLAGLLLTATPTLAADDSIQPKTWHYVALKELVDFSGCTIGNDVFLANRALTRSEFATILKTCQEKISQSFPTTSQSSALQHHRARLQRLLKDFDAELNLAKVVKSDAVDNLEPNNYQKEDVVKSQTSQSKNQI